MLISRFREHESELAAKGGWMAFLEVTSSVETVSPCSQSFLKDRVVVRMKRGRYTERERLTNEKRYDLSEEGLKAFRRDLTGGCFIKPRTEDKQRNWRRSE